MHSNFNVLDKNIDLNSLINLGSVNDNSVDIDDNIDFNIFNSNATFNNLNSRSYFQHLNANN
jgi:hypothetical protein